MKQAGSVGNAHLNERLCVVPVLVLVLPPGLPPHQAEGQPPGAGQQVQGGLYGGMGTAFKNLGPVFLPRDF